MPRPQNLFDVKDFLLQAEFRGQRIASTANLEHVLEAKDMEFVILRHNADGSCGGRKNQLCMVDKVQLKDKRQRPGCGSEGGWAELT